MWYPFLPKSTFSPKTMDYSKAFCRIFPVEPLSAHNSSLEGAMKLRFEQKPLFDKANFSDFGRTPWTITSPWFDFGSPKKVLIKEYHRKGHLKRNRLAQISASSHLQGRSYEHLKSTAVTTFTMGTQWNWRQVSVPITPHWKVL